MEDAMNLTNGTRRLALVLGVAGAVLGSIGSLEELKPILRHYKFEALERSETVKREGQWYVADVQRERSIYFEKEAQLQTEMLATHARDKVHIPPNQQYLALQIEFLSIDTSDRLRRIERIHSELNRSGIRSIRWTDDYGVESIDNSTPWPRRLDVEVIETQGGESLAPTPSPSVWAFLLVAFFPVLGFLVPWGAVCAVVPGEGALLRCPEGN
jgi:hypothetical protein